MDLILFNIFISVLDAGIHRSLIKLTDDKFKDDKQEGVSNKIEDSRSFQEVLDKIEY